MEKIEMLVCDNCGSDFFVTTIDNGKKCYKCGKPKNMKSKLIKKHDEKSIIEILKKNGREYHTGDYVIDVDKACNEIDEMFTEKFEVAYEWYNYLTGHCYVDYCERVGMGECDGYTKTKLYKCKIY